MHAPPESRRARQCNCTVTEFVTEKLASVSAFVATGNFGNFAATFGFLHVEVLLGITVISADFDYQ